MKVNLSDLDPFKEICRKICLNIPTAYKWHWDSKRNMAAVVLDEEDAEMVFYPLFKEFSHHWNFNSIGDAGESINNYICSEYGLMPGQAFFTSHSLHNLVLVVAWWPWGKEDKVSMRVGMMPLNTKLTGNFAYQCLSRWLKLAQQDDDGSACQ